MVNVNRIRFDKNSVSVLSPLENDVIKILWKQDERRVRDIYQTLKKRRKVALTSIAVILDRLYEKKLVSRVIDKTVNKLIDKFGPVAVTYFSERFSKKKS